MTDSLTYPAEDQIFGPGEFTMEKARFGPHPFNVENPPEEPPSPRDYIRFWERAVIGCRNGTRISLVKDPNNPMRWLYGAEAIYNVGFMELPPEGLEDMDLNEGLRFLTKEEAEALIRRAAEAAR